VKKIFFIFFILSFFINYAQSFKIDSLKNEFKNCQTDSCIAVNYITLVKEWQKYNTDSSFYYSKKFYIFSYFTKNEFTRFKSTQTLCYLFRIKGKYSLSLHILSLLFESLKNENYKAEILIDISENYRAIENSITAIYYLKESLKTLKNKDDSLILMRLYNRLATNYYSSMEHDLALIYADSSILFTPKNNTEMLANNYEIIGATYRIKKYYDKALYYLFLSLKLNSEQNDSISIQNNYTNLGLIYYFSEDYKNAINFFEKSAIMSVKYDFKSNLQTALMYLSYSYNNTKNYKKANLYLDSSLNLKISIFENQKEIQLQNLSEEYQIEKQQILLEQQQLLLEQNKKIIQQSKFQKLGLTFTIILILIFLLFSLIASKKLKFKNNKILNQKEELEKQQEELLNTNEKILEINKNKEIITQMIIHDLKNPLNRIISLTKHLADENNKKLNETALVMINLVENILDYAKYEHTNLTLNISEINLLELINQAYNNTDFLFIQKGVNFDIDIEKSINIIADNQIMLRVFTNIFTNAIKYTKSGGFVKVSAKIKNEKVQIQIIDNGIGIPNDKLEYIFDVYSQINPQKIDNLSSTGLGLSFCKKAIEAHDSKIQIKSELEKGTEISFTLKIGEKQSKKIIKSNNYFNKLELNNKEKEIIFTFVNELKHTEIYEITKIKKIINNISSENKNISEWKNLLLSAAANYNTQYFNELLNLASQQ